MSENNLNKKYFTEGDSPVPLIPTDRAWENMLGKLNNQMPEKKKRRMFLWIPPIGCAIFLLLLLAGGMIIWQTNKQVISKQDKPTDTLLTINNRKEIRTDKNKFQLTDVNKELDAESHSEEALANKLKVKAPALPEIGKPAKQTSLVKPASNDNNKSGILQNPKKDRPRGYKSRRRDLTVDLNNESLKPDSSGILPFAFPHITAITEAIAVPAKRSLPVLKEKKSADSLHKDRLSVTAGLQWQAPVPLTGTDYYIKGPDGGDGLYRLSIPGIWLGISKNRHRITVTCMPFASTVMPAKDYETGYVKVLDSFSVMANKRMIKTFGLQTGVSWNYQVTPHWSIGAGTQMNWWKKGLVLARPIDSSGIKPFLYTVNPHQEEKFTSFQLSVVLETGFRIKQWEGILQVSRPLHTTLKGLPAQVSLCAGIRYRLFRKNFP